MTAMVLNESESAALQRFLVQSSAAVDECLEAWLPKPAGLAEDRVFACMRYSVFAGGKRLRPALVAASARLLGMKDLAGAAWAGAALEMLHTYSLMQDDLPSMDNDDLRRGRATAHKEYGEATALLASDGLQTGAFELLADGRVHPDANVRLELVKLAARANGAEGMVAGQMVDMQWEWDKPEVKLEDLTRMNRLKTGVVITAACEAGIVLAGGDVTARAALVAYGDALGRAYQVYDDVLDVVGSAEELGKTPGKDAKAGKTTFVSLLGLEGAQKRAEDEAEKALVAVKGFGEGAETLRLLARYCVTRTK